MLDHEKLDVYQCSIDFLALAFAIVGKIPRGNSIITDHLKRASLSIPLNIAEGVGKIGKADKKKFFAISRGSAMECGAVLDACKTLKLIDSPIYDKGKGLLNRIVSMLTKMCQL